jgi:hypothetical protein
MVLPKASAPNHERPEERHLDPERENEHKGDGSSFLADNLSSYDSRAIKVASLANASYPMLISFIGLHFS